MDEAEEPDIEAVRAKAAAREPLTDAEMAALIRDDTARGNPWVYGGNHIRQGIGNPDISQANVKLLLHRHEQSFQVGHFLETISARVLLLELLVREWLEVWKRRRFAPGERLTFGQLVAEAERAEFDQGLVARMRSFNKARNDAVHHLLRSELRYESLRDLILTDETLLEDVRGHVEAQRPKLHEVTFGADGEIYDRHGRLIN